MLYSSTGAATGSIAPSHRQGNPVRDSSNSLGIMANMDAAGHREPWFSALGRVGCGHALVRQGRVIEACATAHAILERECAAFGPTPEQLYAGMRRLMNRAGAKLPIGSISWLATSFKEGFTTFVNQAPPTVEDNTSTIILLDLDAHPEPNPATLRSLFGFTAAETRLAIELVQGKTPSEIAEEHELSRTTIRSQLASLFSKTQTSRQSELVALLGRLTLLP